MKPLSQKQQLELSSRGLMMERDDLPTPPKGYHWAKGDIISTGNWKYLENAHGATALWMVRDHHGTPCAGIINCTGYRIMPDEMDTFIQTLLTKQRLKLEERLP